MKIFLAIALATVSLVPSLVTGQGAPPDVTNPMQAVGETFMSFKVRDDSAAADWYSQVFGLREVRHLPADDGRYSIRILSGANLTVELIRLRGTEEPPASHFGFFKAGYHVPDIDAAYAWLAQNEVARDPKIFDDDTLPVRTFVFRDLEGNRIQLFQAQFERTSLCDGEEATHLHCTCPGR